MPTSTMSTPSYNWQECKSIPECNMHMLNTETACDVSFRVGEEGSIIRAHRYPLISRSCVFSAMLCGPLAEKETINITDVDAEEFKDFLKFIYTDSPVISPDNATTMLYLAKKYDVKGLQLLSLAFLEACLSTENACIVLEQAHGFGEAVLHQKALKYIQKTGVEILTTAAFKDLCQDCFRDVISSVEFQTFPQEVFKSAISWSVAECWRRDMKAESDNKRKVLKFVLHDIYFPDMDEVFFVKEVVPSKVLEEHEHVKILSYLVCSDVDITPFKTRRVKKKGQPVKIPTFDLNLYSSHVLSEVKPPQIVTEDVFVKSMDKHTVHGFLMHGSGRQHLQTHKYHVKIFQTTLNMGKLLHDFEVTLDPESDRSGVSRCRLAVPFVLKANASYNFQIRLLTGEPPLYVGKTKGVTTRIILTKRGEHSFNILSGLICTEVSPKLKEKPPVKLDPSKMISVHM